jgi:hypothetical protein
LPGRFQVDVVERAVREQDLHVTGLENDTAIHVTEDLLVRPPWVERPERLAGVELLVPRGRAGDGGVAADAGSVHRHRVHYPNS